MKRVWLSGWQASPHCFDRVFEALGIEPELVLSYDGVTESRASWLETQRDKLPSNCVLIGWSLGGMLACELAYLCDRVERVLVINSNVQFAGGPGLDEAVAQSFFSRYQRNPEVARNKFAALIDREYSSDVAAQLLEGDHLLSLQWLYEIQIKSLLALPSDETSRISVNVLLARNDDLVPCESALTAWRQLGADVSVVDGKHSLPLMQPEVVARWALEHG